MGRGGGCFNIVEDRLFDIMARVGRGGGGVWALVRSRACALVRYMCVTEGASCEAQDFRMQDGG